MSFFLWLGVFRNFSLSLVLSNFIMPWLGVVFFIFFLVLGLCGLMVFIQFGETSSIISSDSACVPPFSSEDSTEVCLGLPAVVPQPQCTDALFLFTDYFFLRVFHFGSFPYLYLQVH